jgi:hypothetical protein
LNQRPTLETRNPNGSAIPQGSALDVLLEKVPAPIAGAIFKAGAVRVRGWPNYSFKTVFTPSFSNNNPPHV